MDGWTPLTDKEYDEVWSKVDAFPDAMVEREIYSHLIVVTPNDPKDRHVLAATGDNE